MPITIETNAIKHLVTNLARATITKKDRPIYRCIELEIQKDILLGRATNGELWLEQRGGGGAVACDGGAGWRTMVDATRLKSAVSAMKTNEVEVDFANSKLSIRAGGSKITLPEESGELPKPSRDIEEAAQGGGLVVGGGELASAVKAVAFASDQKRSDVWAQGIAWLPDGSEKRLWFVAADGRRLAATSADLRGDAALLVTKGGENIVVPVGAIRLAGAVLVGDVTVTAGENVISFRTQDTVLIASLLSCAYPPWRRLLESHIPNAACDIPQQTAKTMFRQAEAVLEAGREASYSGRVRIGDGKFCVSASSQDGGEATSTFECNTIGTHTVETIFNLKFLSEFVSSAPKETELTFSLQDPGSGLKVATKTGETVYFQMPQV